MKPRSLKSSMTPQTITPALTLELDSLLRVVRTMQSIVGRAPHGELAALAGSLRRRLADFEHALTGDRPDACARIRELENHLERVQVECGRHDGLALETLVGALPRLVARLRRSVERA
jgi:hypothetical protein